jgi:hypothetical protein
MGHVLIRSVEQNHHFGQVLIRDFETNYRMDQVLIRNSEQNYHTDQVLIRGAEKNSHLGKLLIWDIINFYHMGQVLIRDTEQKYHLGKLLWQNGAIILFLSTLLLSKGANGPQIFCLHCTASCIPECCNDWMRAGGGVKHTKLSKSTTEFELAPECCEVQVRPRDLTLLSLAFHYCLHASYFTTHNFSS